MAGIAGLSAAVMLPIGVGTAVSAAAGSPASASVATSASADADGSGWGWMMGGHDDAWMMGGHDRDGAGPGFAAAATYLDLGEDELRDQLRAGESLADIAAAQGKSRDGLETAMVDAMTQYLDANTSLTAQQQADRLARMQEQIHEMVTSSGSGPGAEGDHRGCGSMWH